MRFSTPFVLYRTFCKSFLINQIETFVAPEYFPNFAAFLHVPFCFAIELNMYNLHVIISIISNDLL